MFQTFDSNTSPNQGPPRLAALRGLMAERGLAGWLVPRADVHQGEYVAPCDARLAWLTGFTGSAGFAAVLPDRAGVFIDGRYRLQVRAEVADVFTPVPWPEVKLADWLADHLPNGGIVGYDPWLHSVDEVEGLTAALTPKGITLQPGDNLVDALWKDRPAPPDAPFFAYPDALAGESSAAKRARVAGPAAAIITLPDSIAWALNIRGADVPKNPVPQALMILHPGGRADLFARGAKADAVRDHLGADVALHDVSAFLTALGRLQTPARIDAKTCPMQVLTTLTAAGVTVTRGQDPCLLPKAVKNATELDGTRTAHLRDGAAMVQFLAWLDSAAPQGDQTEISVVRALEGFRRATNALQDISFDTISGAGPNGAIMHYRVTKQTDRPVRPGELLLVDSGGQYLDGTTDITRTMAVGPVPDDAPGCYTRVLQGLIAISRARFPRGVGGQHLDALARTPLWLAGQDYDHGTGHGVGVYLSVHEGPVGLSRRSEGALEPGMILSNEPGYYREGAFGIRLENLIVVIEAPAIPGGDDRRMLAFETITLVPFDRRLIVTGLLSPAERDWVDAYHARVLAQIGPRVDGAALDWLTAACAALPG